MSRQPPMSRSTDDDLPGGIERLLRQQENRITDEEQTEDERRLVTIIRAIVREEVAYLAPTPEERAWVREAMRLQAKRGKFFGSVAEKTAAGIVWAGVAGLGYAIIEYVRLKTGIKA